MHKFQKEVLIKNQANIHKRKIWRETIENTSIIITASATTIIDLQSYFHMKFNRSQVKSSQVKNNTDIETQHHILGFSLNLMIFSVFWFLKKKIVFFLFSQGKQILFSRLRIFWYSHKFFLKLIKFYQLMPSFKSFYNIANVWTK